MLFMPSWVGCRFVTLVTLLVAWTHALYVVGLMYRALGRKASDVIQLWLVMVCSNLVVSLGDVLNPELKLQVVFVIGSPNWGETLYFLGGIRVNSPLSLDWSLID